MDNFYSSKPSPDEELNAPIPFDDDVSDTNISHSPLNLGGDSTAKGPTAETAGQPVKPVAKNPAEKITSADRITGVKTFFTKLHPGAIEFLDEQITNWLNNNPGITIKQTNMMTGPIQAKKTEHNIIITVWY